MGNLTVYDKTYKGGLVDLGSKNCEFSLTLWYTASASITPALVEISFSYGNSDEYKLILDPGRFTGDGEVLQGQVDDYWTALKALIETAPLSRKTSGTMKLEKRRSIIFYDVPETCDVSRNSYILCERTDMDGKRELTLKYRSADRYIAGATNVRGNHTESKTKFENNITAPFKGLFSHSSKQPILPSQNIGRMQDVVRLYPGLAGEGFASQLALARVGGLTADEKTYEGPTVDLGKQEGEFALTLWYTAPDSITPVLAEISFCYEDKTEQYSGKVARNAKLLLDSMQTMTDWAKPDSKTKTAWVYEQQPDFCK